MTWHFGPLLGVDVETTGVDPEAARIVQAACVWVRSPTDVVMHQWLCDPGVPIPEEATAVHGITTEQAQRDGLSTHGVLERVVGHLAAAADNGVPVVVYNAPYDLTVLDREAARCQLSFDTSGLTVIDPLLISNTVAAWRRPHTLTRACEEFRIPLGEAHEARHDAFAACRLAWRLIDGFRAVVSPSDRGIEHDHRIPAEAEFQARVENLRDLDAATLHRMQIRWYKHQAHGFIDNQVAKGRHPENVNTCWPVIPRAA